MSDEERSDLTLLTNNDSIRCWTPSVPRKFSQRQSVVSVYRIDCENGTIDRDGTLVSLDSSSMRLPDVRLLFYQSCSNPDRFPSMSVNRKDANSIGHRKKHSLT